jgi:CDP-glucose 4,6-dehydratase
MIAAERSEFWRGRPVLITGATGFLGGWLVKKLCEDGAHVVALVRDRVPKSVLFQDGWADRVVTVNGSVEDLQLLQRVLADYSIVTVFHLAAQAIVGVAKMNVVATLQTNVQGTWNVLEAARQMKVQQVLVASSDKAYGPSNKLPYREDYPLCGTFPYDVSKSCADLISAMYARTYGLGVGIVRCANLYGGGDLNFSRTIPGTIAATLRGERFIIRSDGQFIRDFLYVKDAAAAYQVLAEALANNPSLAGEAFNFSLEARLSVIDVVRQTLEIMGRTDLIPIIRNNASAEIREQYMECEKARRLLDWSPRYGMDAGLLETVDWYRNQLTEELLTGVEAGQMRHLAFSMKKAV